MARCKITAYVRHDLADMLKRLAAIDDRSMSDIVADAIRRRLDNAERATGPAAILASLGEISHRLAAIEQALERCADPRDPDRQTGAPSQITDRVSSSAPAAVRESAR